MCIESRSSSPSVSIGETSPASATASPSAKSAARRHDGEIRAPAAPQPQPALREEQRDERRDGEHDGRRRPRGVRDEH